MEILAAVVAVLIESTVRGAARQPVLAVSVAIAVWWRYGRETGQ